MSYAHNTSHFSGKRKFKTQKRKKKLRKVHVHKNKYPCTDQERRINDGKTRVPRNL